MSLLALLLGCHDAETVETLGETPTITFVSPSEGDTVAAGDVNISLAVEHFVLVAVEKHGDAGVQGSLVFTTQQGSVAETIETGSTTFTVPLAVGEASLEADLVFEDGDPVSVSFPDFEPVVITVTVEE